MRKPYWHLDGYMNRYWILPFTPWLFDMGIRIHHILRSDKDDCFHDHPWSFVTIILKGGYTEVTPLWDDSRLYIGEKRTWYGPGSVLFRSYKHWHRLEIEHGKDCWTLFTSFKKRQKWGFLTKPANKTYYREYLK